MTNSRLFTDASLKGLTEKIDAFVSALAIVDSSLSVVQVGSAWAAIIIYTV